MNAFTPDHSQALEVIWQRGWQYANPDTHDGLYTRHRIIGWLTATDDGIPWDVRPVALDEHGNPIVFTNGVMAGRWKLRPTAPQQPTEFPPASGQDGKECRTTGRSIPPSRIPVRHGG